MPLTPEQRAREKIDSQLAAAGWAVQDYKSIAIHSNLGVAVREYPLKWKEGDTTKRGFADYLLYADGRALGVIEAKPTGHTLQGVSTQSRNYTEGLEKWVPAWRRPLPFAYESTGVETQFTNGRDPEPRSREIVTFHRPEELLRLQHLKPAQLRGMLREMPELPQGSYGPYSTKPSRTWSDPWPRPSPARSFRWPPAAGRPTQRSPHPIGSSSMRRRAGSCSSWTATTSPTDAQRVPAVQGYLLGLHLHRGIPGPTSSWKHDRSGQQGRHHHNPAALLHAERESRISTPETRMNPSSSRGAQASRGLYPSNTRPTCPSRCSTSSSSTSAIVRSTTCGARVIEYFDAFLIGLTATPSARTIGFFKNNVVQDYSHEESRGRRGERRVRCLPDQDEDLGRGGGVEAGHYVPHRDRRTRKMTLEELEDDLTYTAKQLDRDVVAPDQIRLVVRTFRDRLFTEIFPGRTEVPKTLVFAKLDSHADDIVKTIKEEFGKGNDFCQKITSKTTGASPEDLLSQFRNSYNPRIAVTVDMIATGTDVKPLECLLFMRNVDSAGYFEQMKGRGVRVIGSDDLQSVTPDAKNKTHFVIVDAVGVCERDKTASKPLERKPSVSTEQLLQMAATGVVHVGSGVESRIQAGSPRPATRRGGAGAHRQRGGRR